MGHVADDIERHHHAAAVLRLAGSSTNRLATAIAVAAKSFGDFFS